MKIYYDVTKASTQAHASGLLRVSARLRAALETVAPGRVVEVVWSDKRANFAPTERLRESIAPATEDWILTPELFSEEERPGFTAWLARRPCRIAALYNDSIPLKFPEITWPHSVARHPHYLKVLSRFDRLLAISQASADELADYLRWLGGPQPAVSAVVLGADGARATRCTDAVDRSKLNGVVMLGIVEPRKNQSLMLDVAEVLWAQRVPLTLTIVGRINPHFGKPIVARIRRLSRRGNPVEHHEKLNDARLEHVFATARITVMPTLAEGCGLPVLESLWAGVPVVASRIPPIVESAQGGGVALVDSGATPVENWCNAVRPFLENGAQLDRLALEARSRALPTWAGTAAGVIAVLDA